MCAEGTVRARVLVSGLVQGVGYRAFAQKAAGRLHLLGGVRNLSDGRVEVVAEGPRGTVEELLVLLRQGPPLSHVSDIQVQWHEPTGEYADFSVWY